MTRLLVNAGHLGGFLGGAVLVWLGLEALVLGRSRPIWGLVFLAGGFAVWALLAGASRAAGRRGEHR